LEYIIFCVYATFVVHKDSHMGVRGVAMGVDIGIYTPFPPKKKSAQVNFLWGKMTSERLFDSFIQPQKLLYPQNKFLATPSAVA